ncbi:19887_t:CDS:1 [Funneliformis geosporum]|uniref:19887_t:CDS:1 n=1 Tax=Funneliformis geosporum TaxID=1117311 RepID=A0A9W4SMZ4_9GLOM|nr:19887_t:CDS:1 [Funneliformis geosporum]
MFHQLPNDCLKEIFEFLVKDKATLCSCLLVNRLWCLAVVPFLWTSIHNFRTFFTCLPQESKEILYENQIIVSPPTQRCLIFNYVQYIKTFSNAEICKGIAFLLNNNSNNSQDNDICKNIIAAQEIFKMLVKQISLKRLFYYTYTSNFLYIPFVNYPGAIDCFKNLSELNCGSEINSELLYRLSQICQNLRTLNVTFDEFISTGLVDLISVQQRLNCLQIFQTYKCESFTSIIPSFKSLSQSLTKFELYGGNHHNPPLSFITQFTNLRELNLLFNHSDYSVDFRDAIFPNLRILIFKYFSPRFMYLNDFLKINGKYLRELQIGRSNNLINLAISNFCLNLKYLRTNFLYNEEKTLKQIFNNCNQLTTLQISCDNFYLNEIELLEIVAENSPKGFHELKVCACLIGTKLFSKSSRRTIFTEDYIPKKILSINLTIESNATDIDYTTINEFKKLGIIKKFKVIEDSY